MIYKPNNIACNNVIFYRSPYLRYRIRLLLILAYNCIYVIFWCPLYVAVVIARLLQRVVVVIAGLLQRWNIGTWLSRMQANYVRFI